MAKKKHKSQLFIGLFLFILPRLFLRAFTRGLSHCRCQGQGLKHGKIRRKRNTRSVTDHRVAFVSPRLSHLCLCLVRLSIFFASTTFFSVLFFAPLIPTIDFSLAASTTFDLPFFFQSFSYIARFLLC